MDTFSKIAAYLGGSCSQEEKQLLESWRKANPANEKEFRKLEKLWQISKGSTSFQPDTDLAWQKISKRICSNQQQSYPQKHFTFPSFNRKAWAVAAAFALFLLMGGLLFLPSKTNEATLYAGLNRLETTKGAQQEIQLADGTKVWLNENSIFYYPDSFQDSIREVFLEGEAYFDVAHQPEKPFQLRSGDGLIEVLGTSFSLIQAGDSLKLQLNSGRLKFSSRRQASADPLILEAGEAALLKEKELKKIKPDPNMLCWKTGLLTFEDTSLKEVFQTLRRCYPVNFKSADPALLECRLFARFEKEPLEEVLKVLSLTLNLEFEEQQEEGRPLFIATGKGCAPAR